jgi:CheY-like chemotaxis protein
MDDNRTLIDIPSSDLGQNISRRRSSLHAAKPPADFRVLVVDDDATIRDAVAQILMSLGCIVSKANDGMAAMASLAVCQYDLVVTDFDMPFMNGYRLSTWLKREFPKTIVVVMTATCEAEIQQYVESGVVDKWLFKPFNLDALCEVLHRANNSTNSYDPI